MNGQKKIKGLYMNLDYDYKQTDLGYELLIDNKIIFFGNKNATKENLQNLYPHLKFIRAKQTHGNDIVEIDEQSIDLEFTADSLITKKNKIALAVSTADCMPALLVSNSKIAAIHSGWRGMVNKVILKTIQNEFKSEEFKLFTGPHILFNSFEIKKDTLSQLLSTVKNQSKIEYSKTGLLTYHLDLFSLLKQQIYELNDSYKINRLNFDTVTNSNFHSFRRDKENSGRQLSFVALL